MVIPHGQEEVFSLQLNWSMILFLVGTLLLAVFLSSYAFYWQIMRSREVALLTKRYGINLSTAISVKNSVNRGMDLKDDLMDRLREIALLIGLRERDLRSLPDNDQAIDRANRTLKGEVLERLDMGPTTDFLPPAYSERAFYFMMQDQEALVHSLSESVHHGLGVYNGMPLGRPLRSGGFIADTSMFGNRPNPFGGTGWELHTGIDTSAPHGTPVFATGAGTVQKVQYASTGYGNTILVEHDNGFYSLYAHLSSINVNAGTRVFRGKMIGRVGRSGRVTGSHLHYEIRLGNSAKLDPLPYVCSLDLYTHNCSVINKKYD